MEISIRINGKLITHRVAVNITADRGGVYGRGMQTYRINDQLQNTRWELKHSFSQGANALTRKMLIRPKAGVITGTK